MPARLGPRDAVEVSPPTDGLRDGGDASGEDDARRAALAQGHLHGLGDTEADAVRGLRHAAREPPSKGARLDGVDCIGTTLRDGHNLLGDEEKVARLDHRARIARDDIDDVVLRRHDVRLDRDAPHALPGDVDVERLALVGFP